jgi:aldose 1-epimerase
MIDHAADDGLVRLSAGDLRLELAPKVGGSVAGFGVERARGYTPLFRRAPAGFDDALEAGCFPLAPYSNRVRDGRFQFGGRTIQLAGNMPGQKHPLHGDGWRNPWLVTDRGERRAELHYRHERADWPWAYEARQRFDLDAEGLTVRLACRNLDSSPMPCGLGLHPYFPCSDQTLLEAKVEWVWTIDDEVMPVDRVAPAGRYDLTRRAICGQDLDNGYEGWSGEATILWPESGFGLTFTCPDATRFQVYSPKEGGVFVAEPVTNANAALNRPPDEWPASGLAILAPGDEVAIVTRFTVAELR